MRLGYKYILIIVLAIVFNACNDIFEFSPYSIPNLKKNEKDINAKNIRRIKSIAPLQADTFSFAIISDTHIEYHTLEDAVSKINNDSEIHFVMHLGDLTDMGTHKEFIWTNDQMAKLNRPYISVIGNHDYRSNGEAIYNKMYGYTSFAFTYANSAFVCFDNVIWENQNSTPDFDWLNAQLKSMSQFDNLFVFAHIPPFGDQFDHTKEKLYDSILSFHQADISFHGHVHSYSLGQPYPSETTYFTAADIKDRVYYKIHIKGQNFEIETISF